MRAAQCPVHAREERVRDGASIESPQLRACRVQAVALTENAYEASERVLRHANRAFVRRGLKKSTEDRLVRILSVKCDEQLRAVAHDRPANAATPLHRVELPLCPRA